MYKGDRSRKETLVEYGFRLPSALDNRPLRFDEWEKLAPQMIFVSATPGPYELEHSGQVVEQLVRPTGWSIRRSRFVRCARRSTMCCRRSSCCVERDERVLITTLTKRMAEDLTEYLDEHGVKVRYLHSDIDTVERMEIIRDLRLGKFDVLVGINLLREGLDMPEVSLVAILDADKEGFLRSENSLIQTIGRAARHLNGRAILYADRITGSIERALDETDRRRTQADRVQRAARHHAARHQEGRRGHPGRRVLGRRSRAALSKVAEPRRGLLDADARAGAAAHQEAGAGDVQARPQPGVRSRRRRLRDEIQQAAQRRAGPAGDKAAACDRSMPARQANPGLACHAPRARRYPCRPFSGARSSAVEHYLDMVGVTGSIPVAPTIFLRQVQRWSGPYPSGPALDPMPVITLPDGSQRTYSEAVSVAKVAADIGPGLAKAALAGKVDGKLVDTSHLIDRDATLADRHANGSRRPRDHPPLDRAPARAGREAAVPGRAGHDRPGDRGRLLLRLRLQAALHARGPGGDRSAHARAGEGGSQGDPPRHDAATRR